MRHSRWAQRAIGSLVSTIVMLAACGGTGATTGGPISLGTWRHGIIQAKADAEFTALYADSLGYFTKRGLKVEISQFQGSQQLTQALLAGQLDSAENNADPVIKAIANGADLKAIGSNMDKLAYDIFSRKSITNLSQLKGKTVGVSAPGAFPDLITRVMLKKQGIEPNNIVLVNAGDDATRYKALVAGKIDAVAASPEFEPQAPNDGVNVLARAIDIVPEWPRFIIWANPNSTKSHPDATVAFLAGMMEGLRYALQHKSEALAFVAKTLDLPATSDRIVFTYQVQAPTVSPNLDVPKDKLSAVAGFLKTLGIIDKVPDTNSMIDTSYQQKALKAIGTYKGT